MSDFERIVAQVQSLKPGQWITFALDDFGSLPGFSFFDRKIESKLDAVLENVIGSAYGWHYDMSLWSEIVTFKRMENVPEGLRTYVSPDRRHHFEQRRDGLWRLRP